MKRIIKCVAAFLLALVLCLCLLPTTAFAASKQVYIWNFPLSDDTLKSSGKWGHEALNLRFGYHVAANNYTQFRCLNSWQGEVAYCIEPGVPQKNYDSLTDHDDTWWDRMTLPAGHVFEAPIDLLSHITLYPAGWLEHSYVACCGTSIQPVLERLRQNPKLDTVYLCLDNDEAGEDACDGMLDTLEDMGYDVERLRPEGKDWNDDLRAKRGKAKTPTA